MNIALLVVLLGANVPHGYSFAPNHRFWRSTSHGIIASKPNRHQELNHDGKLSSDIAVNHHSVVVPNDSEKQESNESVMSSTDLPPGNHRIRKKLLQSVVAIAFFTASNPLSAFAASAVDVAGSRLPLFMGCILPIAFAGLGLFVPMGIFEGLIRLPDFQKNLITYSGKEVRNPEGTPRDIIPLYRLVGIALVKIFLLSVGGGLLLYNLKLPMFDPDRLQVIPGTGQFLREFAAMFTIVDFLTWFFHYICHKNNFLWKHIHKLHHHARLPTPLTTTYATFWDSILNGVVPFFACAALVRPSPWSFYAILGMFVPYYVYTHSGLTESGTPLLCKILFLRFLPFRVGASFHDQHHNLSGKAATDLGTLTYFWDYLFGTLSYKAKKEFKVESSSEKVMAMRKYRPKLSNVQKL